ncbi:hypothetical protein, partial [Acinetobacter guillouiae]
MRVIPLVVTIALAISLVEAFWMLPAHVLVAKISFDKPSTMQQRRQRITAKIQRTYIRALLKSLRRPYLTLIIVFSVFVGAMGLIGAGFIKMDFFASDA